MRERLASMLYGRNGIDPFSRFLTTAGCVVLLISMVFRGGFGRILGLLGIVALVFGVLRMFSRRIDKRREENIRYLKLRETFLNNKNLWIERWKQRKDFKFFTCPSCKSTLRVPRGKGKIRVVCRRCGNSFQTKT